MSQLSNKIKNSSAANERLKSENKKLRGQIVMLKLEIQELQKRLSRYQDLCKPGSR